MIEFSWHFFLLFSSFKIIFCFVETGMNLYKKTSKFSQTVLLCVGVCGFTFKEG